METPFANMNNIAPNFNLTSAECRRRRRRLKLAVKQAPAPKLVGPPTYFDHPPEWYSTNIPTEIINL